MSERIDHAAIARQTLSVLEPHRGQHLELDPQLAQVHATLALVEQQRIANLIALGAGTEESRRALFANDADPWDFDSNSLRPEIAAELGIGEDDVS